MASMSISSSSLSSPLAEVGACSGDLGLGGAIVSTPTLPVVENATCNNNIACKNIETVNVNLMALKIHFKKEKSKFTTDLDSSSRKHFS